MSTAASSKKCPLCRKAAHPAHTPFCSQGCRDRDLLKWLGDDYRVPGPPADDSMLDGEER
jgi:hypothetical protein